MPLLPILYSFRRCPYAIRARMAIARAGVRVELREVVLKDKPADMLAASQKGTVPVLVTTDGRVIDESIDVMHWALTQADPEGWLKHGKPEHAAEVMQLIEANDGPFKTLLDRYKYADRHPEHSASWYRDQAGDFLGDLELRLGRQPWLLGQTPDFADIAIFPFVRQFAMVDQPWFDQGPYPRLRDWLNGFLRSSAFTSVMQKHPRWASGQPVVTFP